MTAKHYLPLIIAAALTLCTTAASAHHSTASYDPTHPITMQGTVKKFDWTNPHMYIYLVVSNAAGGSDQWTVECGTPNVNVRNGWKINSISPGDKITILANPARSGAKEAQADTILLANGQKLFSPGHDAAKINGRPAQ